MMNMLRRKRRRAWRTAVCPEDEVVEGALRARWEEPEEQLGIQKSVSSPCSVQDKHWYLACLSSLFADREEAGPAGPDIGVDLRNCRAVHPELCGGLCKLRVHPSVGYSRARDALGLLNVMFFTPAPDAMMPVCRLSPRASMRAAAAVRWSACMSRCDVNACAPRASPAAMASVRVRMASQRA
jgi:hypothetical protein